MMKGTPKGSSQKTINATAYFAFFKIPHFTSTSTFIFFNIHIDCRALYEANGAHNQELIGLWVITVGDNCGKCGLIKMMHHPNCSFL